MRGGIYEGPGGELLHGDGRPVVESPPAPSPSQEAAPRCERQWARLRCVHPLGHPGECHWQNPLVAYTTSGDATTTDVPTGPGLVVGATSGERVTDEALGYTVRIAVEPARGSTPDMVHREISAIVADALRGAKHFIGYRIASDTRSGERVTDEEKERAYWLLQSAHMIDRRPYPDAFGVVLEDFIARRSRSGERVTDEEVHRLRQLENDYRALAMCIGADPDHPADEVFEVALKLWREMKELAERSGERVTNEDWQRDLREAWEGWMASDEAPDADAASDQFARLAMAIQDAYTMNGRALSSGRVAPSGEKA